MKKACRQEGTAGGPSPFPRGQSALHEVLEVYALRPLKQVYRVNPLNHQTCFEYAGEVCGVIIAPIKGKERTLAKALNYYKKDWIHTYPE